jgi:hypothetical protein
MIQGDGETLTKQIKINKKNAKDQHLPPKTMIRDRGGPGLHDNTLNRVMTLRVTAAETDGQGFSPGSLSHRR